MRALRIGAAAMVGVALAYLIMLGAVHFLYRRVLYPAPLNSPALPPRLGELRTFTARDGQPVHAFHRRRSGARSTIVCFHGNAVTIADDVDLTEDLGSFGFAVMLVEYRGYGLSRGVPTTEQGIYLDAEAALDALDAEGVRGADVVLWGMSLGTGVAAEMAARGRGKALVLLSPYTSIPDVAEKIVPLVPVGYAIGDRFDTYAKGSRIHVPTLVIHGDEDEVIPFAMGRAVASAIAGARLRVIAGGHHNDLFDIDPRGIMEDVARLAR